MYNPENDTPRRWSRNQMIELLKGSLHLEVKTTSEYIGDMTDGPLYKDCHTLKLVLDGEVIGEVDL